MEHIAIISLGCPKNTVDSEILAAIAGNSGFELTNDLDAADIVVVNTCAFIEPAVEEAITTILDVSKLKKTGKLRRLIVAGCLTERYREKILEEMPEVDLCIGIDAIPELGRILTDEPVGVLTGDKTSIDFLELPRKLSASDKSAYIKISDGCDNTCTYCMIPSIRGKMRSRKIENIVEEVSSLAKEYNLHEAILVAQDTTNYGFDIYGKPSLSDLLEKLVTREGPEWFRMLYCYPELIDDRLIEIISSNERIIPYFDIPLQHASDRILKLMGRKGTNLYYRELIGKIRKKIKDAVIRTTFITGFPGESDQDFNELHQFVKDMNFDRIGVFTYCDEDGAASYKLPGKIEGTLASERRDILMSEQANISRKINQKRVGKVYDIIISNVSDDGIFYEARSYGEAPEIDGFVYVVSSEPLEPGAFVKARILEAREYDLIGEVLNDSTQ
ncbi:MAG: 30S ribosomal protein S12 methylthiotransferase RimO [Clostridia bacterium]|nr:30S ribosomal protein S12 methylthiotransferase RimO [Clostridia bacterium]